MGDHLACGYLGILLENHFQDERLTTEEAKSILAERGIKKKEWKKTIDQIAAELILQDYKQAKNHTI